MTEHDRAHPDAPPDLSTRGARALSVVGAVLAVAALFQLSILLGPLGMVAGLVAHLKGDRYGFKVAVVAGITTVVGMSLAFLLVNPFEG